MRRVITFGTFDLLHEGHLKILERSKALGDHLIVGVSSDLLNEKKGKHSIFPQSQRVSYVSALKCVDEVFLEESLELKDEYIRRYDADLLVMGDDWAGKFDWVSCPVTYLSRTPEVSSTSLKRDIVKSTTFKVCLFGDTAIQKHLDCAYPLVKPLLEKQVCPILTGKGYFPNSIPHDISLFFNLPSAQRLQEIESAAPRLLLDHGASHLKWFLGSRRRFEYFDAILTAGPDHVRSLEAIFDGSPHLDKVRSVGFVKSRDLFAETIQTREEFAHTHNLDPSAPIVAFLPTWHKSNHPDLQALSKAIATIPNHVCCLHPESANLQTTGLNTLANTPGLVSEIIKHCDLVISDVSSTLYEGAALGKLVVQVRLREYPDNPALLYDFPLTAGTAELFVGGVVAMPKDVPDVVERLIDGDPELVRLCSVAAKRILAGTLIQPSAEDDIASTIADFAWSSTFRSAHGDARAQGVKVGESVTLNKKLAQSRVIAHAGGRYDGVTHSNARQAIEAAVRSVGVVEVDICRGKDGIIVAHDGLEERYGLSQSFRDTEVSSFLKCKFDGMLDPVSLEEMLALSENPSNVVVYDIKDTGEDYAHIAGAIASYFEGRSIPGNVIVQSYCVEDFLILVRLGFKSVFLAVWKYFYKDPLGSDAVSFIDECIRINTNIVRGITVPYSNKYMDTPSPEDIRIKELQCRWKRVFVHGAPSSVYDAALRENLGVFSHGLNEKFEFQDIPPNFQWHEYLFLNPDLLDAGAIVTEIGANIHYLQHGRDENRQVRIDAPKSFTLQGYLSRNPAIRNSPISGEMGARAHYQKHGKHAGLT